MAEHLKFTYDGVYITAVLIRKYYSEVILSDRDSWSPTYRKSQCEALLRWLDQDNADERLRDVILKYMARHNVEVITFSDWKLEVSRILECLFDEQDYKDMVYEEQCKGRDGCGVIDLKERKFYGCSFAQHWATIQRIMAKHYPIMSEAVSQFFWDDRCQEYEGITREEADAFIMENFMLVGETKRLSEYLGTYGL